MANLDVYNPMRAIREPNEQIAIRFRQHKSLKLRPKDNEPEFNQHIKEPTYGSVIILGT